MAWRKDRLRGITLGSSVVDGVVLLAELARNSRDFSADARTWQVLRGQPVTGYYAAHILGSAGAISDPSLVRFMSKPQQAMHIDDFATIFPRRRDRTLSGQRWEEYRYRHPTRYRTMLTAVKDRARPGSAWSPSVAKRPDGRSVPRRDRRRAAFALAPTREKLTCNLPTLFHRSDNYPVLCRHFYQCRVHGPRSSASKLQGQKIHAAACQVWRDPGVRLLLKLKIASPQLHMPLRKPSVR